MRYTALLTNNELNLAGLPFSSTRAAVRSLISLCNVCDNQRNFPFRQIPIAAKRRSVSELFCLISCRKISASVDESTFVLVELPFKLFLRQISLRVEVAVQSDVLSYCSFNQALWANDTVVFLNETQHKSFHHFTSS